MKGSWVSRGRLALLAALGPFAGSLGCTLVSGWNDLQNGTRADAAPPPDGSALPAADAGVDANAGPPPPGPDSGPSVDSSPGTPDSSSVLMTVACGTTRCPLGDGCCSGILGGSTTCQANAQACVPPKVFASCSDSAQCTVSLGFPAHCCEETSGAGIPTVSCRSSCTSTGSVVCDPTLPVPGCAAGLTCKQSSDGFGFNVCQ